MAGEEKGEARCCKSPWQVEGRRRESGLPFQTTSPMHSHDGSYVLTKNHTDTHTNRHEYLEWEKSPKKEAQLIHFSHSARYEQSRWLITPLPVALQLASWGQPRQGNPTAGM